MRLLPFLDRRRSAGTSDGGDRWRDRDAVTQLLSECTLLRDRAAAAGVRLRDDAASLGALDQTQPYWRDDPEELPRLGNDAGLYLGTVIVRTLPGAEWGPGPDGGPVVVLSSGREIDVVRAGQEWADCGSPELSQLYAEVTES